MRLQTHSMKPQDANAISRTFVYVREAELTTNPLNRTERKERGFKTMFVLQDNDICDVCERDQWDVGKISLTQFNTWECEPCEEQSIRLENED